MLGGYNRYVLGPKLWRRLAVAPPALRQMIGTAMFAHAAIGGGRRLPMRLGLAQSLAHSRTKPIRSGLPLARCRASTISISALVAEWSIGSTPALGDARLPTRLDDGGRLE